MQKSAKLVGGCKSRKNDIAENPRTQSVASLQSQPPRWQKFPAINDAGSRQVAPFETFE
jgi:hypothetical protein